MRPGYKQTEVGVIPEDWSRVPLGNIVTFQRGFDLPHHSRKRGIVPIISSAGVTDYHNTPMVSPPGVITGRYGTIGEVFFVEESFWPLNTTLYVRDFHGNDAKFVYYLLQRFDFHLFSGKSGVPGVNRNDLHLELVWVPVNTKEQCVIAEALSDADGLIESLEQLITKKRCLKQGAMQELLTGKKRLPGFSGEWEVKRLGDLFNFSGGYSASRDQLSTEGYCYLHYGDIHTSKKTFVDVRSEYQEIPKLDIPLKKVSPSSMLDDGDIVFVDASEDDEGTSKHVIINNPDGIPFISGLHTIVAKSKTKVLENHYRRYCFQTSAVKAQFRFFAVGTKVSGISKTNIVKVILPVPSIPEQTAIAAILSDMDGELAALEAKLAKARSLKQGMMQELLTGRIRLVQSAARIIPLPTQKHASPAAAKSHNWQINEAVIIGVLAKHFGSEKFPLARKRCTKLTYLLHRHVERQAEGYLKKAAGPYNPATRYKGPEGIAQKNGYVRPHHNGTYPGFVAADNIDEAEAYFTQWYGPEVLPWLEQFRFKKTDELELLTTVDMAMEDLRREGVTTSLGSVKQVIHDHPEWEAKLEREIFADPNIIRAIDECREFLGN